LNGVCSYEFNHSSSTCKKDYTLRFFSYPVELEQAICGTISIDVADWKANSDFKPSRIIDWFWSYVESLDQTSLEQLLFFTTGSRRVPVGGFSRLRGGYDEFRKFSIIVTPFGSLPRAHTCFSQLDLPEYTSKEMMEEKLELAMWHGDEGFFEGRGNDTEETSEY
jgi:hypothetical protein